MAAFRESCRRRRHRRDTGATSINPLLDRLKGRHTPGRQLGGAGAGIHRRRQRTAADIEAELERPSICGQCERGKVDRACHQFQDSQGPPLTSESAPALRAGGLNCPRRWRYRVPDGQPRPDEADVPPGDPDDNGRRCC
jgi:hypothetical protein